MEKMNKVAAGWFWRMTALHGGAFALFSGALALFSTAAAQGETVYGRLTLGAYASTERFSDSNTESAANDAGVISARAYLRVEDLGESKWEFITDLRDKNDFFGNLDKENRQLTNRNDFQLRQMSLRKPAKEGLELEMGRFAVNDVGNVYVDGGNLTYHFTPAWKSGIFGGLNPHKDSQRYLEFDPQSTTYGVSLTFDERAGGWDKNFYMSHALVNELFGTHTDRSFLFHNIIYQWTADSRLISLAFVDFVPNVYLQMGNLTWQQALSQDFGFELSALHIDVVEYFRRQSVLDVLSPSPYTEGSLQLIYRPDRMGKTFLKILGGQRNVDQ
ncbi:MAG: hypothetical protein C5B49_03360, partial [Bdellovibrio sp.]